MSEYFTIETQFTDDPDVIEIITSETLTDTNEEVYHTPEEGEFGSPVAQTLFFGVDGILALTIVDDTLIVRRDPAYAWETMVDEIRDVLRDFFL